MKASLHRGGAEGKAPAMTTACPEDWKAKAMVCKQSNPPARDHTFSLPTERDSARMMHAYDFRPSRVSTHRRYTFELRLTDAAPFGEIVPSPLSVPPLPPRL